MQDQDDAGGWLTLAEAARQAGCSIDTLRRRLKRGALESRQVPTRHGLAWQVRLGTLPTLGSMPTQTAQPADVVELLRLVRDQQQTILELSARLGYYQAQLERARETIRALEAPGGSPGVRGAS